METFTIHPDGRKRKLGKREANLRSLRGSLRRTAEMARKSGCTTAQMRIDDVINHVNQHIHDAMPKRVAATIPQDREP